MSPLLSFSLRCCLLAMLGTFLLAGCLNLEPTEPPTRFYLLALPEEETPPQGEIDLVVRAIGVPMHLGSPRMVIREDDFQMRYLSFERWAEPLNEALPRLLVQSLRQHEATGGVQWRRDREVHPDAAALVIEVEEFAGFADGSWRATTTWHVTAPEAATTRSHRLALRGGWEQDNYASLAAALSETLPTIAEAIVASLP